MRQSSYKSHCPVNFALETFGDKWSLLIVRDIVFFGKRTYSEFLSSKEGIATNILSVRLKQLEHHDILSQVPHPSDKRKEIYMLTEKGLGLIPVLLQMEVWSTRYDAQSEGSEEFVEQIEHDVRKVATKVRALVASQQDAFCLPARLNGLRSPRTQTKH